MNPTRRDGPAYVNQSPRNWHRTKKLITKIMHPRSLRSEAPSALSGESRHPRLLMCFRPSCSAPLSFSLSLFCGYVSCRIQSREFGNYSFTIAVQLTAFWLQLLLQLFRFTINVFIEEFIPISSLDVYDQRIRTQTLLSSVCEFTHSHEWSLFITVY